jgi:hypothetical protein
MFLPQVQEADIYDANGQQVDDINSIVELINVELGYDKTADDEDDDSGQNFHLVKLPEYSFQQQSVLIEKIDFKEINRKAFPEYKVPSIKFVFTEIVTPPPDFI